MTAHIRRVHLIPACMIVGQKTFFIADRFLSVACRRSSYLFMGEDYPQHDFERALQDTNMNRMQISTKQRYEEDKNMNKKEVLVNYTHQQDTSMALI